MALPFKEAIPFELPPQVFLYARRLEKQSASRRLPETHEIRHLDNCSVQNGIYDNDHANLKHYCQGTFRAEYESIEETSAIAKLYEMQPMIVKACGKGSKSGIIHPILNEEFSATATIRIIEEKKPLSVDRPSSNAPKLPSKIRTVATPKTVERIPPKKAYPILPLSKLSIIPKRRDLEQPSNGRHEIKLDDQRPKLTKSGVDYLLGRERSTDNLTRVDKNKDYGKQKGANRKASVASVESGSSHSSVDKPVEHNGEAKLKAARKVNSAPLFKFVDECILVCNPADVCFNDKARRCHCCYTKETAEKGCSNSNCLNRAMRYECPPRCAFGELCKNRRFQNREYPKLERFAAGEKGFGLRALEPIAKDTFIIEYVGEIIDRELCEKRSRRYARNKLHKHHYLMSLDADTFIDATRKGNNSRFINHSCDPNAATEKWTIDRRNRIGFFAIKDIKAGEEIVFDYKFERFGKRAQKCFCGAANCRGYISSKNDSNEEIIEDDGTRDEMESDTSDSDGEMSEEDSSSDSEGRGTRKPEAPKKLQKASAKKEIEEAKVLKSVRSILNNRRNLSMVHISRRLSLLSLQKSIAEAFEILQSFDFPRIREFSSVQGIQVVWLLADSYFHSYISSSHFPIIGRIVDVFSRLVVPAQESLKRPDVRALLNEFSVAIDKCSLNTKSTEALISQFPDVDDVAKNVMIDLMNTVCAVEDDGPTTTAIVTDADDLKARIQSLLEKWDKLPHTEFRIPKKPKNDVKRVLSPSTECPIPKKTNRFSFLIKDPTVAPPTLIQMPLRLGRNSSVFSR